MMRSTFTHHHCGIGVTYLDWRIVMNYNNAIIGAGRKALVLPWAGTFSPPFLRLGTTCQR